MAIESCIRAGSAAANLRPCPIQANWILEGSQIARVEHLCGSVDGAASTYFWDCTAGRFNWYYHFDETLYVLEGSVTLKDAAGTARLIAGGMIFFPAGSSAEWTVDSYIRKLAFCRTPLPSYFLFVKQVGRRIKRLFRGGRKVDDSSGFL